jgi:hypothetical protein
MIWRMHQFVYQHEMVKRVLADMSVQERIVYECSRRDVYLQRLAFLGEQEDEIQRTEAQIGVKHMVAGEVQEIPPWATEEFQAQFKGMRVASAEDIVEGGMEALRLEETKESRPKRRKPADPDWDLYWDDEPLLLSVREMQALWDEAKEDEPGYPQTVKEVLQEMAWVFGSMLEKGETFEERQGRYRRSVHRERHGCEAERVDGEVRGPY